MGEQIQTGIDTIGNFPKEGGESQSEIFRMRVIEGTTYMKKVNIDTQSMTRLPLRVRIIVGPDTGYDREVEKIIADSTGHFPAKALEWLFEQSIGDATQGQVGIKEDSHHPEHPDDAMLKQMMAYGQNGILTIVSAHGVWIDGNFCIGTNEGIKRIDDVISQVKVRDEARGIGKNTTLVLASCNAEGNEIKSKDAAIFYRTGIAGEALKTGKLVVSIPK